MKRLISRNGHFEAQRAPDSNDARDYCLKEATRVAGPWELGTYLNSKRNDIVLFRDAILSGSSEESLWMQHPTPMARYRGMFQTLYSYGTSSRVPRVIPRRDTPPIVTVLIGPTGCGKTRYVYGAHNASELYVLPITDGFWMDNYSGQEAVLFDEFTGRTPLDRLLALIDAYAIMVPIKGGFVLYSPKYVYITSNLPPLRWYEWFLYNRDGSLKVDRTEQRKAMYRRFSFVYSGMDLVDITGSDYDLIKVL